MKKIFPVVLCLGGLAAGSAMAGPVQVAVGVHGGLSTTVLQDVSDTSELFGQGGSSFALRVPVKVIPVITFEPFYAASSYKDRTQELPEGSGLSYTREGFDSKAYGLNAILGNPMGGGFKFFPYAGLGKNKLSRTGEEINEMAYDFGFGFGFSPADKMSIQLRSDFNMVVTDNTSRKFGSLTLGFQYQVLPWGVAQ